MRIKIKGQSSYVYRVPSVARSVNKSEYSPEAVVESTRIAAIVKIKCMNEKSLAGWEVFEEEFFGDGEIENQFPNNSFSVCFSYA